MKLLIQRVTHAKVEVKNQTVGVISTGLLIFVGITHSDTNEQVLWLANKLINLRVFEDEHGKLNQSLLDISGEALIVSQFTLYADCNCGRRPSFIHAATSQTAQILYEKFIQTLKQFGINVQTGIFGAQMQVTLCNDGPVTLMLER